MYRVSAQGVDERIIIFIVIIIKKHTNAITITKQTKQANKQTKTKSSQ